MRKTLALTLLAGCCLAVVPMVQASETASRTANDYIVSNGNFNTSVSAPAPKSVTVQVPVATKEAVPVTVDVPATTMEPIQVEVRTSEVPTATAPRMGRVQMKAAPASVATTTVVTETAIPVTPVQTSYAQSVSSTPSNIFQNAPTNARPGECYGKVRTPAQYRTVEDKVLVSEGGKQIARINPAKYQAKTQTVTVKEATEELVTIPATYRTVTETITVTPATTRMIATPASYKTVTERVQVSPARTVWKQGEGPNQRIDAATGDVMCLVEVPAEYKNITKRVLVTPEATLQETVPAVTKQITKRVIDQPARVERRAIPAVTEQITTQVLVQPEQPVYEDIAPQYKTTSRKELVKSEQIAWTQILCNTNVNRSTVMKLQQELKNAGYNPGRLDGVLGDETYEAVFRFQRSKNLPAGQITMETLRALGLQA